MFRHERPQKGRYRQFYQVGVETYGMPGPDIDAEIILLSLRLWRKFGIESKLELQLNSLGSLEDRNVYRERLVSHFESHRSQLDEDSLHRLTSNPLRILDSKNPAMEDVIADAPVLSDYLGEASSDHFDRLLALLDNLDVSYTINPRLVRGLDYYGKTVFEWVTRELGTQGAVCAGGRYDGLIEQLGAKSNCAVGFAMGMERLIELLSGQASRATQSPVDVYLIHAGDKARLLAFQIAEGLRDALPELKLLVHCGPEGFKSQFKRADRCGAAFALILGDDETARGTIGVKSLRGADTQFSMALSDVVEFLRKNIKQDQTG
ncbi:MAG: histidine--tRNA ligase, partial [Methylococcales bacterium]